MLDTYKKYLKKLDKDPRFSQLCKFFEKSANLAFNSTSNGNLPRWLDAYRNLPDLIPAKVAINCSTPYATGNIESSEQDLLEELLHQLHPWRKGPYRLFDIFIDTEWRSDWKWERLAPHIKSCSGKNVLDIGCGNGYHCFRIAAEGANSVTGIDTSLLSIMQFKTLQKYLMQENVDIFPVGIQNMPDNTPVFDTVLSMGVLYHRKDHLEHLNTVHSLLTPGGEAVIETLVIDGEPEDCLIPENRYAMMKNVYAIPSVPLLESWLADAGFCEIRTVDVTVTSTEEQRSTDWMKFHSLSNFLNPDNKNETIEGYPAPKRAIIIVKK
jgi:tRNA (mo5U34)-methyltransferase